MNKFIIKIAVFGVVILLSIAFVFSLADGQSDLFYKRFTSTKQTSLLIGSSRIAQALMPSVINKELKNVTTYNYGFTYNLSPYGLAYLNNIKKKLDTSVSDQIFILDVNPWGLVSNSDDPNNAALFSERGEFIETLTMVNSNPNYEYLIDSYAEPFVKLLHNNTNFRVEDDGYLMLLKTFSTEELEANKDQVIINFTELLDELQFSKLRLSYLKETISYLKNYGEVYLVRLPISAELLEIENTISPDFDGLLFKLSAETNVTYLNYLDKSKRYNYIDGHHLSPESAKVLSLDLAKHIKQLKHQ
ncbi:hypothetical protein [Psychroserpens sp.]|uniref:hypothetical protein n=1 Tax=Psychroserpens sp. TaxID=2020870 RepID=UPI003C77FBB9